MTSFRESVFVSTERSSSGDWPSSPEWRPSLDFSSLIMTFFEITLILYTSLSLAGYVSRICPLYETSMISPTCSSGTVSLFITGTSILSALFSSGLPSTGSTRRDPSWISRISASIRKVSGSFTSEMRTVTFSTSTYTIFSSSEGFCTFTPILNHPPFSASIFTGMPGVR